MLERRPAFLVLLASFLTFGLWSKGSAAGGWQEMHETSDDVRLEVAPDGVATIQHHLRYRIVAGHFKTFDLVGVDPRAEISSEAVFTPEKGGVEVPARVEPVPKAPGTLRVLIDEGKGLGRGAYVIDVKYRLDLVATKMLTRDGAMWKVAWTAPPAPEGHDGARVIFDFPAAPTEPRLAATAESTTTLATLRRSPEHDELELVRAHVPRGEAVTWSARVDPKAFPRVTAPELRSAPTVEVAPPSLIGSNLRRAIVAAGFALLAGLLAALLRTKQKAVRAAAALRAAEARPLVVLPWRSAPFVYGAVAAAALAVLLWSSPVVGALLVALAMALAVHASPRPIVRPRGPGAWRPLSDRRAFVAGRLPLPTDTLDIATPRARLIFAGSALGIGLLSWLLRPYVPQIGVALPLASAALVPIFVTGTRSQLSFTPAELAARFLRPARDALSSAVDLAHVDLGPIGRVVGRAETVDEIRLACAPRDRTPGLRAIELALATSPGVGGATPLVFVRFDDGSELADRIAHFAFGARVVPGRAPEERVVVLSPDEPTPTSAAALVAKLVLACEGRRATDRADRPASPAPGASRRSWTGRDRRRRASGRSGLGCAAPAPL